MRRLLDEAGLSDRIEVDSAGTGAWHAGSGPDPRAVAAAAGRGISLTGAARQVRLSDFEEFDRIVALDRENARDLRRIAPDETARAKVRLLREYDPAHGGDLDVPDPYYGADDGFGHVLDLVDAACRGLIEDVCGETGPS